MLDCRSMNDGTTASMMICPPVPQTNHTTGMGVVQWMAKVVTALQGNVTNRNLRKVCLERAKGIEPSYRAWEALVLPLNYARLGVRLAL